MSLGRDDLHGALLCHPSDTHILFTGDCETSIGPSRRPTPIRMYIRTHVHSIVLQHASQPSRGGRVAEASSTCPLVQHPLCSMS
jgi:hypothetical protein